MASAIEDLSGALPRLRSVNDRVLKESAQPLPDTPEQREARERIAQVFARWEPPVIRWRTATAISALATTIVCLVAMGTDLDRVGGYVHNPSCIFALPIAGIVRLAPHLGGS